MDSIQTFIEKIETDLQGGRPEEEVMHSLLAFAEKDPEKARQVLEVFEKMGHPRVGHLLQRWSRTTADKKIQKMIKRSIYRLKSRGIAIEDRFPEEEKPVFRIPPSEPPVGYGSPVDYLGRRFLMLSIPRQGRGILMMQGLLSDTEGWVDFSAGEMGRKQFKEFLGVIRQRLPFVLVEMEAPYVAFLFDEAYHLSLRQGRTPPQDYLEWRRDVESIRKTYEKPPVYSLISEEEVEGEGREIEKGADLHKTDLFNSWILNEEEIRPYAEEVRMAEESRLVLHPHQKEARFHGIYLKALSELFSDEVRSRYQKRMEEMAYYLYQSGRKEEAKISLSVALSLKKPLNPFQPNPFLLQLVVKSIFTYLSQRGGEKQEFSLITEP